MTTPSSLPILMDERSSPSFRRVFGRLLSQSTRLDSALLKIRFRAIDLSATEMQRLEHLRVLVGGIEAQTLEWEAHTLLADPSRSRLVRRVLGLLAQGTLSIRAAPLAGWAPDFSVFSDPEGPRALLLGPHWFQAPFPHRGPAWGCLFGPGEAARAVHRFDEVWGSAHDIGRAIQDLLNRTSAKGRKTSETPETQGQSRTVTPPESLDTLSGFG